MLNTDSKLVSLIVWLAVAAIVVSGAWTFFRWPAAEVMLRNLLDSELAAFMHRNQIIFAALLGLGGASLAYLFNGWRDRAERRHVIERAERRDGSVLAREARDIADLCEAAAERFEGEGSNATAIARQLAPALAPQAHMLLAASPAELARLGAGASAAARAVRLDVQRLVGALEPMLGTGESSSGSPSNQITRGAAALATRAARSARSGSLVFDALAKSGPAEADRVSMRLAAGSVGSMALQTNDNSSTSPRLLPAA